MVSCIPNPALKKKKKKRTMLVLLYYSKKTLSSRVYILLSSIQWESHSPLVPTRNCFQESPSLCFDNDPDPFPQLTIYGMVYQPVDGGACLTVAVQVMMSPGPVSFPLFPSLSLSLTVSPSW